MFLYLSKKISMPDGLKVKSVAWNLEQGWLACGGELGLLKVLKLDSGQGGGGGVAAKGGVVVPAMAAASNLSMNQTLEGHHGTVLAVNWNPNYRKLTSSDEKGLVIVWVLHKGMWFEEMINHRNKSVVRDLRWSGDGLNICIVYEDGQVVIGDVYGNKIWDKEVGLQLCLAAWSPDSRMLLFCSPQGECHVYDSNGNFISQLALSFPPEEEACSIAGLDWYYGSDGQNIDVPTLAIALQTGNIQLMRHELDEEPILVGTRMTVSSIKWNADGEVLAVLGLETGKPGAASCTVQLYSNFGIHIRTLHVPGTRASALAWEGSGLRLALAVDEFVYLASVRPDYKWTFFGGSTCVYSFKRKDLEEHSVMFWDIITGERYLKYVKRLVTVCGSGEYCALATKSGEPESYILILCNAIGNPLDSKYMHVEPLFLCMNSTTIFVSSEHTVFWWKYSNGIQRLASGTQGFAAEADNGSSGSFHIDDAKSSSDQRATGFDREDQICCVCATEKYLMVGRESGIVHRYSLPALALEAQDVLKCRPQVIQLNCNSTRLAVIDMDGLLTFYDIHKIGQGEVGNRVLDFERKAVWNMKWAGDNPDLLAVMEKTRMYILRSTEPEEPVSCTAYLCSFHGLQIHAVQLDEIMGDPEQPGKAHVFSYETKSLRDTLQILATVDIEDAYSYVREHSHPKLWMTLAEFALEKLNLSVAEKAFVQCQNYYGIQFVKGLHIFRDQTVQKAEICVYFKRFDDAERMYIEMDRMDLAIDLRIKLGDWFIVERLINGRTGNDALRELAWNKIGDFYVDRQNWVNAAKYYTQANNSEKLVDCFYSLEDWDGLEKLLATIHDGSPLLLSLAQKFLSVGLCEQAVVAFCRAGDSKAAIDCCIGLNHWDKAVELSRQHNCEQAVDAAIMKYTVSLLQSEKPLHALEVFQKGRKHAHAAVVLRQLAEDSACEKASPVEVKKLYVLAALEMASHNSSLGIQPQVINIKGGLLPETTTLTLKGLLDAMLEDDAAAALNQKPFEDPWKAAEAYHFWLQAHRDMHAGHFDQALKAARWLTEYEDIIGVEEIYCLIGLAAFKSQNYLQCSKAFIKLEALEDIPEIKKKEYKDLAFSIFRQHPPEDPQISPRGKCPECNGPIQESENRCSNMECRAAFPICLESGMPILSDERVQCSQCKHFILAFRARTRKHCPLCHAPLTPQPASESRELSV